MISNRLHLGRWPMLLLAALLLPALVIACGDDDDDDSDADPTETAAATATATEEGDGNGGDEPTATPTEPTDEPAFPVTVTDLLDREVEIEAEPVSIVALSPTAVELVYAVGGEVVGRSASATYPPEAEAARDVGSAYQPAFDVIASLNPDLIIADSVIHVSPNFRTPLEGLDIPVIFAGAESYDDVLAAIEVVGLALGRSDEADSTIADIEAALDDAIAELDGVDTAAVALIADRDQTLYAAKDNSYIGDVLVQLGIENPAGDQPDAGPFPGYSTLAPETLLQFDPPIIFTITPAPPPAPRLSDLIPQIPPFAGLAAVTGGNVVEVEVEIALQAPGPRVIELFEVIVEAAAASGS